MTKKLIVRVVNGQWYATRDGKHLAAQQVQKEIAKGASYRIISQV